MSFSPRHRTPVALGATAFIAVTLPLAGAGTAAATPAGDCDSAKVQYRIAGAEAGSAGADWTSRDGFHAWDRAPGTIEVRLAPGQNIAKHCEYPVSLAAYATEGPDWKSSGRQTHVDQATVKLTAADIPGPNDKDRTWQSLTVKTPDCYAQVDLYGDDIVYDGQKKEGHGPAPYQPEGVVMPHHLIAAWNGGEKECTPDKPDSPTPTTPSEPSPPEKEEPPADEPDEPGEPTPPKSEPTPPTNAEVPPVKPSPPASPKPEPSPNGGETPLADTGSSAPVGLISGGAAVVIALGAGMLYATRIRRKRS